MIPANKQDGPMIEYPPEPNSKKRYVLQAHFRGKSVHLDFRVQRTSKQLEGWTILAQEEGVIQSPVTTLEEARKWSSQQRLWKLDLKTGKIPEKRIDSSVGGKARTVVRPGSLMAETKPSIIPAKWLDVEGVFPAGEDSDPGEPTPPGATAHFPGVFHIMDSGKVSFGARKARFFEYHIEDGEVLSGRIVFRYLSQQEKEIDEDIWNEILLGKAFLVEVGGAFSKEGRSGYWAMMTPQEKPYVLTHNAQKEGWIPPSGVSALPSDLQQETPDEFRYWKPGLEESKRKELRNEMLERKIEKNATSTSEGHNVLLKGASEEERIVYGVVLQPGVIDLHDDVASEAEVAKTAWYFMMEGQEIGIVHKGIPRRDCRVVESFVAPVTFRYDENDENTEVLKGSWVLAVKLPEDIWLDVKSGKLTGFSIQGTGKRRRLLLP